MLPRQRTILSHILEGEVVEAAEQEIAAGPTDEQPLPAEIVEAAEQEIFAGPTERVAPESSEFVEDRSLITPSGYVHSDVPPHSFWQAYKLCRVFKGAQEGVRELPHSPALPM